jgi:hypothetical protein
MYSEILDYHNVDQATDEIAGQGGLTIEQAQQVNAANEQKVGS